MLIPITRHTIKIASILSHRRIAGGLNRIKYPRGCSCQRFDVSRQTPLTSRARSEATVVARCTS